MADIATQEAATFPVTVQAIAARQRLSAPFLEQILRKLRRAGLVESRRGVNGGYRLARRAAEIPVSEVVRAVEEEIRSTACQPGAVLGCTGTSARCLTHHLWSGLDRHIESYLADISLADIADKTYEAERAVDHG
ncbi:Rrf2 family protein [Parvularcula bermudensis HTCC2503]|uniref:Rrf2 family protein n=2 Tax=Parvularcula TaxID=208215 RepID=E0TEE3_PARBH|nr:Rrf2 family protein [Parvularcula bermudensis HTCC2503]